MRTTRCEQLSVFLENRPGILSRIVKLLADSRIDLMALSLAETQDYGMLRLIVDKPRETAALLQENGWPCSVTEVLAVTVPDEPGSLTRLLARLAEEEINIIYSYAFLTRGESEATIVLRVPDLDAAANLLTGN